MHTTVEILDTIGQKHVFQRKDIASLTVSPNSIMPMGFEGFAGGGFEGVGMARYSTRFLHREGFGCDGFGVTSNFGCFSLAAGFSPVLCVRWVRAVSTA